MMAVARPGEVPVRARQRPCGRLRRCAASVIYRTTETTSSHCTWARWRCNDSLSTTGKRSDKPRQQLTSHQRHTWPRVVSNPIALWCRHGASRTLGLEHSSQGRCARASWLQKRRLDGLSSRCLPPCCSAYERRTSAPLETRSRRACVGGETGRDGTDFFHELLLHNTTPQTTTPQQHQRRQRGPRGDRPE